MEVTPVSSTHLVSTLTLARVSASVSGLYTCVAINSAGVAASSVSLCHMFCTLVYIKPVSGEAVHGPPSPDLY